MVKKLESLCDSCYYCEIKTVEGFKNTKYRQVEKCVRLTYFCNFSLNYKQKFVGIKECEHYRPKQGQINKKVYQKGLFET